MSEINKTRSLRSIEWLNFFLADVQTGLGPFLAAYHIRRWNPGRVGFVLTFGGLVTVALQTPQRPHNLRASQTGLARDKPRAARGGRFLLMGRLSSLRVYCAQFLIGGAGAFLAPTVAAITMGIIGPEGFDKQFGRNQSLQFRRQRGYGVTRRLCQLSIWLPRDFRGGGDTRHSRCHRSLER